MEELTRRNALRLTAGALAAMSCASCASGEDADGPSGVSQTSRSSEPSTPLSRRELAAVADVPDGSAVDVTAAAREPAYLARSGDSTRLLSATCTHASCRVAWQPTDRTFLCPCHHGTYDIQGEVLSGPPPRGLEELPIIVED